MLRMHLPSEEYNTYFMWPNLMQLKNSTLIKKKHSPKANYLKKIKITYWESKQTIDTEN